MFLYLKSPLMFTGIIEATATLEKIEHAGENINFTLTYPFTQELKINQR